MTEPTLPAAAAARSPSPVRGKRALLYIAVAAAVVVVVVAALGAANYRHREAQRQAVVTTQNLAATLDLTIEGLIDTIDLAVLAGTDEIARQIAAGNPDAQAITRFLIAQQARIPSVAFVRATDARGNVIYGPGLAPPGGGEATNNADRDYFVRLRDDPRAGLLVVKPLVGRTERKWVWLFARRIDRPDGSFGGVIFAAIFLDRIEAMLARVKLGPRDSITLRDQDLGLVARYPPLNSIGVEIGDRRRLPAGFVEALEADPREGTFVSGATAIDGISRIHSYRRNPKYGFTVSVGLAQDDVLAAWRVQAWTAAGIAAGLVLAILVFAVVVRRAWLREQQDMASLLASRKALQEAQDIARLGSYAFHLPADRWTSSDTLDGIFGIGGDYPRDAAHWLELIAPAQRDEMRAYLKTVVAQRLPFEREYRIVRPDDGRERWVQGKGKLQFDERGNPSVLVGTIQDITERKAAEARIGRLSNLYAALVQCSQAIVRSTSAEELYERTCRSAVQLGGLKMAWVGLLAEGGLQARPVAALGEGVEYLGEIGITADAGSPFGRGTFGTAVRENRPVWVQDYLNDPMTAPWHERAARAGWGAAASLPLLRNGAVVGALTLVAREINAFDRAVRELLIEMAADISFALDNFDRESRRRRAEEALRESEASLRLAASVFDHAQEAITITDADANILTVNRRFTEITGYSAEEAVGRNPRLLKSERQGGDFYRAMWESIRGDGYWIGEIWNRRKDGTVFPEWLSISAVRDERGEVTNYVSVFVDISQRVAAGQALRESEHIYRTMFDSAPEGVWLIGPDRRTTEVNQRMCDLLGVEREDMLGRDPVEFADATNGAIFRRNASIVPTRYTRTYEVALRHRDGHNVPTEFSATNLFNEDGSAAGVLAFVADLTERKQAETVRASLEAQLREAHKMEAIGTLAGGIAHDFNNILATILGNVELARQDAGVNPQALESLDEIRKAGSRARDLVQQILAFSRRQPIERKPIALAPVVDESVRLLRATLPARLTLEAQCDASVPAVLADATQVQQVVINLATNAMQAMRDGPGRIGIRLDAVRLDAALADEHPALRAMIEKHAGNAVRLAVSDEGPGMDEATRARIFEPFFTTKPVGEGTGLGLSVVHGIVKDHEGAITVASQPGKGTTFTVYLPVAGAGASETQTQAASRTAAGSPARTPAGGRRILYLDDDDALVFLARRLLERRGYRISGYTDQEEALAALRADPAGFDLVVTDYNMPGLSGLDVARAVRAIRADLPVAVASGFIDEALSAQAESAGVRELIFKADAAEDLCEALARLAQTL